MFMAEPTSIRRSSRSDRLSQRGTHPLTVCITWSKKVGQSYTMMGPKTFEVDDPPPAGEELDQEESVMKNHHVYGDGSFTWLRKITIVKNNVG